MPLKRLELCNFKSYRGTQVIQFGDAPFTCIIGPNGAGKSNLMDAISFVLGVRSAQLRSTQLRDLVYRGRRAAQQDDEAMEVDQETQTQDDQDARTAWVMVVYEDSSGREYKFKRTVNTSGQSTYSLNGQATDYRKYNAQLEKFNILVKAKNFLVFQGDVEGVASQDSRALARLIDRISGSLDLAPSYEAAKAAQDRATEASTANYAKKRSMLTEAKHFREQKEEVRQWERLRDMKDNLIQRYILWKLYHLTDEIQSSTRKVEEASERLAGLRTDLDDKEEVLKDGKKQQAQDQLTVRKREAAVKRAEKAHEDKKPELVTVDAQIAHSKAKSQRTATLVERVGADEARQADNLQTLERGAADIKRNMEEAGRRQRQRSQSSGRALSGADLDDYRNLRAQANNQAVSERQQAESLRRDLKTQRDALASVHDRITQAERQREKLSGEVDVLGRRDTEIQARVENLSGDREKTKAKLEQAQAERQRINIKETEINERLQDAYHKLLQAGVDKQEDERERRLKETLSSLKRIFPGVYGRIVDLCTPASNKLDTAVMTVLGRNLDSVVVENEKTAIECIEYMRSQRAGQATFIPLDTIQTRAIPERLRNFARGARLAIDCIEYQPAVERAMQHACGAAMICDSMEVAKYICYEKGQEVKAVTLDGTVIHRSGLITGGRGASNARKFNDTDVQNLQRQRDNLVQQLKDLAQARPKEKDDDGLLSNLAQLEAELTIAQDDLEATHSRLTGLRSELEHAENEIRRADPERQRRQRTVTDTEFQLSGLTTTINQADDQIFGSFCRRIRVANIREYEDVQLKIAKEESDAMEAFSAQQARVHHQITFETAQLRSTRERLEQLRSIVDREQQIVETLETARQEIIAALHTMQQEIERQRGRLTEAQASFETASQKVDELRDGFRRAQRSLDKALKEVAGWNGEIEKSASDRHALYRRCRLEDIDLPLVGGRLDRVPLELDATETEMDVDNDDRTQRPVKVDDYGVQPDFDALEDEDRGNPSEDVGRDLEEQINTLKADLERLVPNVKAIDRLDEVEANLNEAEEEAEDTRRKSKEARDEFQRLKKKRCDLFNAAYNHMSGCIDKIYKDLTKSTTFPTGGVGFLSLEDADEPYLSGVKYNVMPPGKRFVEMEQLSGGEKTMAALALLFSIHSFQPAPFFVLDEVDAALDPTNVSKLARYVRNKAEDTQFLIISLKSTLYEHADGLVGVYREQEQNSSSTLTLDLRKYAE